MGDPSELDLGEEDYGNSDQWQLVQHSSSLTATTDAGMIQIFDLEGAFMAAFGSYGNRAGSFSLPAGILIEGDRIYVADSGNGRIQMFRYRGDGG